MSFTVFRPPEILFIRGVFKDQIRIEKVAEATARPQLQQMLEFWEEGKDAEWNAQRPTRCATCRAANPDGTDGVRTVFVPSVLTKIAGGRMRFTCQNSARFCDFPCAAYHIKWFLNNDERYKKLLAHLLKVWEDTEVFEVAEAEHPWTQEEYGGDHSPEVYRMINEEAFDRLLTVADDVDYRNAES